MTRQNPAREAGGREFGGVWFPAVRAGTGADVFTLRLSEALTRRHVRNEITWLPHRAEYAPWTVNAPRAPNWASIIHVNNWLHARFYARNGLPVLATCHSCVHDPAIAPYKTYAQSLYHRGWIQPVESTTLLHAGCVTAVSRYTAARMTEVFGRSEIEVVPNWLPSSAFVPPQRAAHREPFRLLYVGAWRRAKGSDLLVPIMKKLGPRFELGFTGTPPKAIELPANMRPLGWSSDPAQVREWMRKADALLFPSRLEGMSLAVLEAMACGLPVIATDCTSLPELIIHGANGLLCPTDNVNAFAAAAERLHVNPAEWVAMQEAAFARAKTFHTEEAAVESYLALYSELIERTHLSDHNTHGNSP